MSRKYQNKYRVDSIRLKNWDYGSNAAYFITICTQNRTHFFGHIQQGKMHLSPIGVLADAFWYEIKNREKHIHLDEYVIMPNHIHGILVIDKPDLDNCTNGSRGVACNVPTGKNQYMSAISPKPGSVSTIIRSYKSSVTKHANRLGIPFGWQPRFYDHIIRNETAWNNIRNYIINNPKKWSEDRFC